MYLHRGDLTFKKMLQEKKQIFMKFVIICFYIKKMWAIPTEVVFNQVTDSFVNNYLFQAIPTVTAAGSRDAWAPLAWSRWGGSPSAWAAASARPRSGCPHHPPAWAAQLKTPKLSSDMNNVNKKIELSYTLWGIILIFCIFYSAI